MSCRHPKSKERSRAAYQINGIPCTYRRRACSLCGATFSTVEFDRIYLDRRGGDRLRIMLKDELLAVLDRLLPPESDSQAASGAKPSRLA